LVAPAPDDSARSWRQRTASSLAHRDFRTLWIGMLIAFSAMQMQQVASGYLAYEISGSATALGVVSLGWAIPMMVFSLFGGVAADRVSKRKLLLLTQAVTAAVSLVTAVLVASGEIAVWHLFVTALINGTAMSFNMPTRQALMSELVPQHELTNAMALSNAGMNLTRIAGPALAGGLIAVPIVGLSGVYFMIAALYVAVVISYLFLPDTRAASGLRKSIGHDLRDGLGYVRSHEVLAHLLVMGFIVILLGMPFQLLLPVFAEDVFDVGALGLGLLFAVGGIGALAGSMGIAGLRESSNRARVQTIAGITFGASLAAFALAPTFPLALAAILVVDGASAAYMALNGAMIMAATEQSYRGRVMSIYMMTFSLMPLASLPMSAIADQTGVTPVVVVAGATIVVSISLLSRAQRRTQTASAQPTPAVPATALSD
jgi:MFS family permease